MLDAPELIAVYIYLWIVEINKVYFLKLKIFNKSKLKIIMIKFSENKGLINNARGWPLGFIF